MPRNEFSRKTKREALRMSGGVCNGCGEAYGHGPTEVCGMPLSHGVEFDHILPVALGGLNDLSNCLVVCRACHKFKTKGDIRRIRKADRQRDKHTGTMRKRGSFQTNRDGPFKKTFSHGTVRRK